MVNNINKDLKQMEKNTWQTQFIDGSADIGIGILIAVATFFRFNPQISFWHWFWMLLPIPFVFLIKKYITTPRLGTVKFSKERIRKDRLAVLIMSIILAALFGVIFLLLGVYKAWLEAIPYKIVFVATGLFIVWSAVAYFRDFPRLYLYGFLAAISIIFTGANTQHNPMGVFTWSLTSVVMVVIGIVLLVKFIKKYPKRLIDKSLS